MAYYSKKHYQMVSPAAWTDAQVAYNKKQLAANEQAGRDMRAKFPILTPENFGEAIAYQEARIKELMSD